MVYQHFKKKVGDSNDKTVNKCTKKDFNIYLGI